MVVSSRGVTARVALAGEAEVADMPSASPPASVVPKTMISGPGVVSVRPLGILLNLDPLGI